jgi:hypothetical protein
MARTKPNPSKDSSANLGFEAKLWLTSGKYRPVSELALAA